MSRMEPDSGAYLPTPEEIAAAKERLRREHPPTGIPNAKRRNDHGHVIYLHHRQHGEYVFAER